MRLSHINRPLPGLAALACLAVAAPALAGGYTCPGGAVYAGHGRCSDGSLAVYVATTLDQPRSPEGQPDRRPRPAAPAAAVSSLFGAWSTRVPGGVWTSPGSIPGWETLHVGIGALSGLLVIYPDGRYVWNAYGGKRGTWSRTNDGEYPILLDDRAEHRVWKVGLNTRNPSRIYVVEGNGAFYYEGQRAR
jgi:hypothetical protein